ncbi:rhomboid family intramembrane serine protease [Halorussus limi]|uniref:Rhomboid family intramembrane serine protease n=1 Tax=Halorussus limi TaxID=2938695 RepID=A0A8U0HQS8_9EURY|nr:rhomboid family intramembrane serine protease [Halorussus limi]UPV73300.1 rhomboid family intramembrane serine protease [Halorussus limi]
MAQCDECGEHENMPYKCRRCGGTYCSSHRLPESHDCPGLNQWDDPEGVFDSGFDDSVNDRGGSGGITDRIGVNTGPGGPLGYFRNNMTFVFLGAMWIWFAFQWGIAPFLLGIRPGSITWYNIFTLNSENIFYGYPWITSVFSHGGFGHIALNSIVLYFFGPVVERRIGSKKFAALFLVSGAVAGIAQVVATMFMNPGLLAPVLGASGAIAAILGVLTVLNPNLTIYLYFILPMPLWLATTLFVGYSVFVSATGGIGAGGVAQLAHLAGVAIGLAYGAKLKREGERAPQELQLGGGGGPGRGPGGPGGRF